MNWLVRTLRARTRVHVLIALLCALGVGIAVLVPRGASLWSEWKSAKSRAEALPRYGPPILRVCTALASGAVAPEQALDAGRPYVEALFGQRVYSLSDMTKNCASVLSWGHVPRSDYRLGREYPRLECADLRQAGGAAQFARDELNCDIVEMATQPVLELVPAFVEFTDGRGTSLQGELASSFLPLSAIALIVFTSLFVGHLFLTEAHAGWRRIAILAAVASPPLIAVGMYIFETFTYYGDLTPEGLTLAIVGTVVGPMIVLGGRRTFMWVRDGFDVAGAHEVSPRNRPSQARSGAADGGERSARDPQSPGGPSGGGTEVFQRNETGLPTALGGAPRRRQGPVEADFWPRAAARSIDLCLALALASVVPLPYLLIDPSSVRGTWILVEKVIVIGWIVLTVIAYELLFTAATGRTIGKWLMGLRIVMSGGESPTVAQLWRRTSRLLTFGVYWMVLFPFLQLLGAYRAYRDLDRNRTVLWDRDVGSRVIQQPTASWRTMLGLILAALMIGVSVVGQRVAKDGTHERMQDSFFGSAR